MRIIIVFFITYLLSACGLTPDKQISDRVKDFYISWLTTFDRSEADYRSAILVRYVSADTLNRLKEIMVIPEQEIVTSDYFTYTQDYDPAWINALTVDKATDFMGGKAGDVWLGVEDKKWLHLKVYLRHEEGIWKIYRVRDITNNFEHKIVDSVAINQARVAAENEP